MSNPKAAKKTERARGYCWTSFNVSAAELERLEFTQCQYITWGLEVCPETKKEHLQGYTYFKDPVTWSAAKKRLGVSHVETQKGTNKQAITYCHKDGKVAEFGTKPKDRKDGGDMEQVRWQEAWESAKAGDWDGIPGDIKLRQYGTIKRIMFDFQPTPAGQENLDFHWWWGASGSGKSRTARAENPDAYLKCINKWWDGYAGEPCVIIDEWEPCHECLASHLKRWCDHHPFAAEFKGGSFKIRPPKIIITSNYSIEECFPTTSGAALTALLRRFTVRAFE